MSTERRHSHTDRRPLSAAHRNAAIAAPHTRPMRPQALAEQAMTFVSALPASMKDQTTRHPYRALGVAVAVGFGAGIVLGSSILRAAFVTAASAAIVEIGRTYLLHQLAQEPARPSSTTDAMGEGLSSA